jgi:hypothetical protein
MMALAVLAPEVRFFFKSVAAALIVDACHADRRSSSIRSATVAAPIPRLPSHW